MEYFSTIKGKEVLVHASTWIHLKNIMLSKRNQTQKVQYCMIPFIGNIRIGKSIETENRLEVARK